MWFEIICLSWLAVVFLLIRMIYSSSPSIEGQPGNGEIIISYHRCNSYTNYEVYYKRVNQADVLLTRLDIVTSSAGVSLGIITQLTNGEPYDFYLTARRVWSIYKKRVAHIQVTPQLTPPANFMAMTGQKSATIVLSWSPVPNAAGYEIDRSLIINATTNFTTIATILNGQTTAYIDKSGLVNGEKYSYRIAAIDSRSTSKYSSIISAISRLATPSHFKAVLSEDSAAVVLSWSTVTDATGYEIQQASGVDNMTTFSTIATIQNGETTTYIDRLCLENGKTYSYRIAAIESRSKSELWVETYLKSVFSGSLFSSVATVTLPLTPPANFNAATTSDESASISLSWSSVTNATSYEIQRSSAISDMTNFSTIGNILIDQMTTYVDRAGLVNGETYNYRILAINSQSRSAFSSIVSATPQLMPPTNFRATAGQESATIILSWSSVANATGYKIDRSMTVNATASFTTIATISNDKTTIYIDKSGLLNGETYHYRIAAIDSRLTSEFSSIISAISQLTAPSNFKTVLNQDSTTVALSWSTVTDATGYEIQRALGVNNTAKFSTIATIPSGQMTTYIDKSGLRNGKTYNYRILAIDNRPKSESRKWAFWKDTVLRSPFSSVVQATMTLARLVNSKTISIQKGDLAKENVDAIVVSSSSELLRKAILKAAGPTIEIEYADAAKINSLASDSMIITSPGQLLCKKIFFLPWNSNSDSFILQQALKDFVNKAIQCAIDHHFRSIAFPAVGCGQYGCPIDVVAETLVSEVKNQLEISNYSMEVVFVIQTDRQDLYDAFIEQKKRIDRSIQEESTPLIHHGLPSNWERSNKPDQMRFTVPTSSTEYKSIIDQFRATIKPHSPTIVRLERTQNERWYKQYKAHEEDFQKRLKKNTTRTLYHGCPEESVNAIIKDGFNRSYAGVNGTVYGFGVYFAADAHYSDSYAKVNSAGEQHMFVVKVLIGNYTRGDYSMKVCPVGYDSTTNGSNIFVAYHDAQSYAEYLITYKR